MSRRDDEADQASIAFHIALTQIGAGTIADALALWQGMPPSAGVAHSAAWLRRAIFLIIGRRDISRSLALAYFRLVRALRTGRTVADPYHPDPDIVTLGMLRREFAALTGPATPEADSFREGDDEVVDVDVLPNFAQRLTSMEADARDEAGVVMEALGSKNQTVKVNKIDTTLPADTVDSLRDEAHRKAGSRQAAAAERVALNGARSTLWAAQESDKAVVGYVRVSRTGTPCGWCAMLISRGPVYKSAASASYSDGDLYHDNDKCYAMPVFSFEQYETSDLFALNREYSALWPKVTRGLGGKDALTEWRRYFRANAQAAKAPTTKAQEAA